MVSTSRKFTKFVSSRIQMVIGCYLQSEQKYRLSTLPALPVGLQLLSCWYWTLRRTPVFRAITRAFTKVSQWALNQDNEQPAKARRDHGPCSTLDISGCLLRQITHSFDLYYHIAPSARFARQPAGAAAIWVKLKMFFYVSKQLIYTFFLILSVVTTTHTWLRCALFCPKELLISSVNAGLLVLYLLPTILNFWN